MKRLKENWFKIFIVFALISLGVSNYLMFKRLQRTVSNIDIPDSSYDISRLSSDVRSIDSNTEFLQSDMDDMKSDIESLTSQVGYLSTH